VERVIEAFSDKDMRERFYKFFKELETLYEILSPDEFLRPYMDDYQRLAALYQLTRSAFGKHVPLLKDLMRKTEALVKEKVTSEGLTTTLPIYEINEGTLTTLRECQKSETVKVINLLKSLQVTVQQQGATQPALISIGERAEAIAEAYEDRQMDTQDALKELEKLIAEKLEAEREQARLGFDINTFAVYWTLKKEGVSNADALAPQVNAALRQCSNWQVNQAAARQARIELTKVFANAGLAKQAKELVDAVLKMRRAAG
jgi:type I restriction enzyme R subunit